MAVTWDKLRSDMQLTAKEEQLIAVEKELIRTLVKLREEQGMTQAELADRCGVKQPTVARIEASAHSPQINSFLKVLLPLGYTLQIVPLDEIQKS